MLSLLIPLFNLNLIATHQESDAEVLKAMYLLSTIQVKAEQSNWISEHWQEVSFYLYGIISIAFLGYLSKQIYSIYQLKKSHVRTVFKNIELIETEIDAAPFSFLNTLFWKKSIDLASENGQIIFKHELTHIQQKHSFDRLFCQLTSAIFWINPFNWMIQKELEHIHEFIADQEAVGPNNTSSLAKMILEVQYGNQFLNPKHTFFYSSIKRRIIMLKTSKNTKFEHLRKMLAMPLFATLAIVFSLKIQAQEQAVNVKTDIKKDQKQPKLAITNRIPEKWNHVNTIKVPKKTNKVGLVLTPAKTNNPLIVVDGNIMVDLDINKLSPDKIESINVLKGEKAIEKYAQKGSNGVIEIKTKKI
ncbi:M56 family metallopeptidase [Sandaracinomonas limnophila]|uniref:M56 family metallopeptidase n=1 Tax=Sandaracinomonas limnophila TaxID=1862386 RepID=UPI0013E312B3|nr:M56 family metallopeptidase [Sandaracinomonas limnophila]